MIKVDLQKGILSSIKVWYPGSTNRKKSYANEWYSPIEFQVGGKVFLRVSPTRGVMRIEKKVKLSSRFVYPYEIPERNGDVAYCLW